MLYKMAISDFQNFEFLTPKFAKIKNFMKKLNKIDFFFLNFEKNVQYVSHVR